MLPRDRRVHARAEFADILKRGARGSGSLLSVHLLTAQGSQGDRSGARAGLVVSRAVGGSVARHRTARRLRHLLSTRLNALPAGSRLVVRAAPGAAPAGSAALGQALDAALSSALSSAHRRGRRTAP